MLEIAVIYETDDYLVINKPNGVPVQNERLGTGIIPLLQQQRNMTDLWLVHRLDKVTSGLLLLAKTQSAAARLSGYFADRKIAKYYLAISAKKPKKSQGTVSGDMHKVRRGQWALTHTQNNPAVSQFFNCSMGDGLRLFIIKPLTGKTHQIRVMLKSLGSPILGDTHYSGVESDRTYLHAYSLAFTDNGKLMRFQCLPASGDYFMDLSGQDAMAKYLNPWDLPWPCRNKSESVTQGASGR